MLKDCEKTNEDRNVIPKVPKTLGNFFENFEKKFWVARQISQFLTFRMFVLVFWAEVLGLDGGGFGLFYSTFCCFWNYVSIFVRFLTVFQRMEVC